LLAQPDDSTMPNPKMPPPTIADSHSQRVEE